MFWLLFGGCCCVATPLACILVPVRWLVNQDWPQLRRALFFPIAGQRRREHRTQRDRLLRALGGKELLLRTEDGRHVHGVWIEKKGAAPGPPSPTGKDAPCETPAVLLLHANAMVLDDMVDWAQFYLGMGASVMLLTFWGYPDPQEDAHHHDVEGAGSMSDSSPLLLDSAEVDDAGVRCPTERGMYLDAEAALHYIQQSRCVPTESTLVHGLSIGGACAAALGVQHPGLRVTLDQTFASLSEVSLHVGEGLYDQLVLTKAPRSLHSTLNCSKPILLRIAVFVLMRMLFKRKAALGGSSGDRSSRRRPVSCEPDRMDNLKKASQIKGDVFAIFSEDDEMMPHTIAPRLVEARYGKSKPELLERRILRVPGGHCAFLGERPELAREYEQYLISSGFLPP